MNRPFNIFPSIGYKNSQFQIISTINDLEIKVAFEGKEQNSITVNSDYPTILSKLEKAGKYKAICYIDDLKYEQIIEIKNAFRIGSSELKSLFIYDEIEFSIFLMNDRLLIYDENRALLLTENDLSPTDIKKVNQSNLLFITNIGNEKSGIVNLGLYDLGNFEIVGELLNQYKEVQLLPDQNKVWLEDISNQQIVCFEIINMKGEAFSEIKRVSCFLKFIYNKHLNSILFEFSEEFVIIDLISLIEVKIAKSPTISLDKNGFVYEIKNEHIYCSNLFLKYEVKFPLFQNINLEEGELSFLGTHFTKRNNQPDYIQKINALKESLTPNILDKKSKHYIALSENEIQMETCISHEFYPTTGGMLVIESEWKSEFKGVTFLKNKQDEWEGTPHITTTNTDTLFFSSINNSSILIEPTNSFGVISYNNQVLITQAENKIKLIFGKDVYEFESNNLIYFLNSLEKRYILVKDNDAYSLYNILNLTSPLLKNIIIHNFGLIQLQQAIWYSGVEKLHNPNKTYLNCFLLADESCLCMDEDKTQHSLYKDSSDYIIQQDYILSSNKILIQAKSGSVKDSILGDIILTSEKLDKVVSRRGEHIYLSKFNPASNKYFENEINIDDINYKEAYLSPNGKYLMLQDNSNAYLWYDIEKDETVKFLSGNFLSFTKEGSLIFEDNKTRAVKIFDPITFNEITPPNYHHYRFLSPDGKLYSQIAIKVKYFNKITEDEITSDEASKIRIELDDPSIWFPSEESKKKEYELAKVQIAENREKMYNQHKEKFNEIGIKEYDTITFNTVVRIKRFTEIGIVGTNKTLEIIFPDDLAYYNYAAFSFDNQYFGYVGKPSSNGLIHLFKISYDEKNNKLTLIDSYLSRYPRYASWVCGFSKTGYFATYDSTPDTYILKCDDQLFVEKTNEMELREFISKSKLNIYNVHNKWNEIKRKNFLCFSPSGNYLALSEQGYEPLTMGGYGHQESNAVHIAATENGKILDSFLGHGAKIKDNKMKKVTFVAFSADEKRIMTMSSDGVVVVRDINLTSPKIGNELLSPLSTIERSRI